MVGRITASQTRPQTYEFVTLHGERNFADDTALRISKWRDYHGYPGGPNAVTRVFTRGRQKGRVRDVTIEAEVRTMTARSYEPRNPSHL